MHFSGLFKDILIKEEITADGLTASTMVKSFFFFLLPPPIICKIGVWLNTCKLCCDYQPLKSSLKINLYIVKFPCLFLSSLFHIVMIKRSDLFYVFGLQYQRLDGRWC